MKELPPLWVAMVIGLLIVVAVAVFSIIAVNTGLINGADVTAPHNVPEPFGKKLGDMSVGQYIAMRFFLG